MQGRNHIRYYTFHAKAWQLPAQHRGQNFFGILKTECIHPPMPKSLAEALTPTSAFIQFYSRERIQLKKAGRFRFNEVHPRS